MDEQQTDETVHIQLHSSIQHPGQKKERHTLQSVGRFTEKNGVAYLQYEEEHEGQKIKTIVKIGDKEGLIMRSGAVNMRLPFSIDEMKTGTYRNDQMTLKLQVKTNGLLFAQQDARNGKFKIAYELHAEGSILGTYELLITYSEGKK